MKNLTKSMRLTLILCVFFSIFYILVLWLFAYIATPNKGKVETINMNKKTVGAVHIGQSFKKDIYFWGRPSYAGKGYDATHSGGSNKGASNIAYLRKIETRIDTFLVHHPYLKRSEIPAEMVTASGSGLDPDISPESAYIQVKRIAKARNINEQLIKNIVNKTIEKPFLRLFGPAKVNVIKLNIQLDTLTAHHNTTRRYTTKI